MFCLFIHDLVYYFQELFQKYEFLYTAWLLSPQYILLLKYTLYTIKCIDSQFSEFQQCIPYITIPPTETCNISVTSENSVVSFPFSPHLTPAQREPLFWSLLPGISFASSIECHRSGIIHYLFFNFWFLSLCILFLRFIHVPFIVACQRVVLCCLKIPQYNYCW